MQTTLLGFAIAAIVALLAALAGPLFIDWTQYRAAFESHAGRMIGTPVRISGAIDLRLLPAPYMTVQDVTVGESVAARELRVEFALAPILRGEWRASDVKIVGPNLQFGLQSNGRVDWPISLPEGVAPDTLSIARLSIEDGRAILFDAASGAQVQLEKLWFMGELRSLAGPYKGEGGFWYDGARHGYRLNIARAGDDGTAKARLLIDPSGRAPSIEADGALRFEAGSPRFEGTLALAQLPTSSNPDSGWRATSKVRAGSTAASLEGIEVQIGSDERASRLGGSLDVRFGRFPRIDGVLASRQLNLDRVLGLARETKSPAEGLRAVGDAVQQISWPDIPARVSLSIDALTLAGSTLQSVRGDVNAQGSGWDIERVEFRAPGLTQVRVSGHLDLLPSAAAFTGPAIVESADPKAFLAWLEGNPDTQGLRSAASLRAEGVVTLGSERMSIEQLAVDIDRKPMKGRLAYAWPVAGRNAKLEAELKAADLDLDALQTSLRAIFGGTTAIVPGEVTLALDLGRATLFGTQASGVAADIRMQERRLAIERLSVSDFGGAAIQARGTIEEPLSAPHGALTLDVEGRSLDGILNLLAQYAPEAAGRIRARAQQLSPLNLRAHLTIERGARPELSRTRLGIEGRAGTIRVGLTADGSGGLASILASAWRMNAAFDADDGQALVSMLSLDQAFNVERRGGSLRIGARGVGSEAEIDARLAAGGLDISAKGPLRLVGSEGASGNLAIALTAADARPLRRDPGGAPLPVSLKWKLTLSGEAVAFEAISGTIADTPVAGRLALAITGVPTITGRIEADHIDASAFISTLAGVARQAEKTERWSSEPFAPLGDALAGEIAFQAARATLSPLAGRGMRWTLRMADGGFVIDRLSGVVAGGQFTGELALRRLAEGSSFKGRFELRQADAVIPLAGKMRLAGRMSIQGELEGVGLTPAAVVGSLVGTGQVSVEQGELTGVDVRAFDVVLRAADRGLIMDPARVADMTAAAFNSGRFAFSRAEGVLSATAGTVRLASSTIASGQGDLSVAASADLVDQQVDARLVLIGGAGAGVEGRPEIGAAIRGPFGMLTRTLDSSPLVAWLALRSVERQTRQLEKFETMRPEIETGSVPGVLPQSQPKRAPDPAPRPGNSVVPSLMGKSAPNTEGAETAPALPPPLVITPSRGGPARDPGARLSRPPGSVPGHDATGKPPSTAPVRNLLDPLFGSNR